MECRSLLQGLALAPLAAQIPLRHASATSGQDRRAAERAREVLEAAFAFPRGGGYDTSWRGTGVPEEIRHDGERILGASTTGTYCCGFTFAVAMRVLAARGALAGKSAAAVRAFQKAWYGATAESRERQCALAVEALGVGRAVAAADAQAGDFAQLWRVGKKPSGHSVLFLAWVEVGDERVGFVYLSSQGTTDGIGLGAEWFADAQLPNGRVDRDRLHLARLD